MCKKFVRKFDTRVRNVRKLDELIKLVKKDTRIFIRI